MEPLAVVNYSAEAGAVELRPVAVPEPAEDEVLLEVGAVSVCGSDVHQWRALNSWPVRHPVVLGHEFCGTVRDATAMTRWPSAAKRSTSSCQWSGFSASVPPSAVR